jgi:hypothetical protein
VGSGNRASKGQYTPQTGTVKGRGPTRRIAVESQPAQVVAAAEMGDLQGDFAAEQGIACQVDRPHPAVPKLLDDLVPAEHRGDGLECLPRGAFRRRGSAAEGLDPFDRLPILRLGQALLAQYLQVRIVRHGVAGVEGAPTRSVGPRAPGNAAVWGPTSFDPSHPAESAQEPVAAVADGRQSGRAAFAGLQVLGNRLQGLLADVAEAESDEFRVRRAGGVLDLRHGLPPFASRQSSRSPSSWRSRRSTRVLAM